jgi:hypothetical protein
MPNTLIKVFDEFSAAQNAREKLLASGFSPASVHLTAREDEAGPVEGNFYVGNKDDDNHGIVDTLRSMFSGNNDDRKSNDPYTRDFKNAVHRGLYTLTVDASSDDESSRASDIMDRFSGSQPGAPDAIDNTGHS